VPRPGVAHRADQLAYDNPIAYRDMPRMGMQDSVKKAVRIPDGDSPSRTLPSVFHHAVHRCAQSRMLEIDSPLPIGSDGVVDIDAAMRVRGTGRPICRSIRAGGVRRYASGRRQYSLHNIFPRHDRSPSCVVILWTRQCGGAHQHREIVELAALRAGFGAQRNDGFLELRLCKISAQIAACST